MNPDRLQLRDEYLAKIEPEGSYRLVVAEHLRELLDALYDYLNNFDDDPSSILYGLDKQGHVDRVTRLILAYNVFVSNPAPATPDREDGFV